MFGILPFQRPMSEQADMRSKLQYPMVYVDVPPKSVQWEYRTLTIDPREEALPDAALLNELGNEGWLLAEVLEQKTTAGNARVHYYFMRQRIR
jgi:hypothetical protein